MHEFLLLGLFSQVFKVVSASSKYFPKTQPDYLKFPNNSNLATEFIHQYQTSEIVRINDFYIFRNIEKKSVYNLSQS